MSPIQKITQVLLLVGIILMVAVQVVALVKMSRDIKNDPRCVPAGTLDPQCSPTDSWCKPCK